MEVIVSEINLGDKIYCEGMRHALKVEEELNKKGWKTRVGCNEAEMWSIYLESKEFVGRVYMTIDNIFKYIVDGEATGGIIIASDINDAKERINSYYESRVKNKKFTVWKLSEDADESEIACGVYEIYDV